MYINFLNKNIFSIVLTMFLIVGGLHSNFAKAAGGCKALIEESFLSEVASTFQVSRLNGVEEIQIKPAIISQLRMRIKHRYKLYVKNTKEIRELIAAVAQQIKGATDVASIEKSNQMAEVGRLILNTVKADLNPAQTKMIAYLIAETVLKLETFKISEFKADVDLPVFNDPTVLHINKFHSMVESYINKTAEYTGLSSSLGIISVSDIRNLYVNNSWILSFRPHDMRHLHYAYGHPYYLAVNLHASRSINDKRYAMTSSLWESVDLARYGYESSIANYFKNKNMSAEEAMLFLGGATEKELEQIKSDIGAESWQFDSISYAAGWRPVKTTFGRDSMNYNEASFLKEIEGFVNTSLAKMKDPNNAKYFNYRREVIGTAAEIDQNIIP